MTMLQATPTTSTAETNLRMVLRVNGALSTVTGLAGLIFGGAVAELLGVDQTWLVRLLGASLAAFAAVVIYVSTSSPKVLRTWTAEISLADIGWVIGTVFVIALGWLSNTGAIVMSVIGLAVLGMGATQWKLRSQLPKPASSEY